MRFGGVDASVVLVHCGANAPGIDEFGDLIQKPVLGLHVSGLKQRPGEHELMVNGDALGPEDKKIGRFAIDESDASSRRDQRGEIGYDAADRRRRKDERGAAQTERCDLRPERLFVVDDMVSAHVPRPFYRLGPRGGCDDRKIGQLPRELDRDRAPGSESRAAPGTGFATSSRSNIASHAVIEVSGKAAAAGKPSVRGLRPTIRSSTR
jgi:hypothetical protein